MAPIPSPPSRPARTSPALPLTAALMGLAVLAACRGDTTPAAAQPAATPTASTHAPAPAAQVLAPVIRELGPPGALPTEVVLEFPRTVVPPGEELAPGTTFDVAPAVEGHLRARGPSTLVFTPRRGFAHDTEYTFRLTGLQLPGGRVEVPAGGWSHRFRTPGLAFLGLAPQRVDARKGKVEVELLFSGPVDAAALRRVGSFTVEGQALTDVRYAARPGAGHRLVAQLTSPRLKAGATLRFALQPGLVPPGGGTAAPGGEDAFELHAGKRLVFTSVALREGPTGHYLEVACRDVAPEAAQAVMVQPEGEEFEGDPEHGEGAGCMVDEGEAADALRFSPAVKLSVAPSRRGFRVFGDFRRGTYAMRVEAGTTSVGGGVLDAPYERSFSVPARSPQLSFTSAGRYLPRSAWRNLPLNHLNLDGVELTVRHVPPENLVFWMSDDATETADARTSNVLLRQPLPLQGAPDALTTSYVDVGSLVPATTRGLVELTVVHSELRASSRILLTDLSLVAKRGGPAPGAAAAGEVWVWALGMESTELLQGVEVSLLKRSGQAVARCTTAGPDGCRLQVPAAGVDDAEPFALVARRGEDFTYLKYSELRTDTAGAEVHGEPYRAAAPYRASLYADRGVYRPGDTAHVVAVVRGEDGRAPPAGLPVELQVVDPRERDLKKAVLRTNEAGLVTLDVPFEAFQDTGRYSVRLEVGGRRLASHALAVEEFVPERMKVGAQAERDGYVQGDEVPVRVEARYLFGGSAAGSAVEVACRLEAGVFAPGENAGFTYGVWQSGDPAGRTATLGSVKAELDAQGQARVACAPPRSAAGFKGPARLVAQASVFEAGSGRSSVGEASVAVHPEPYYVGLQSGVQKVQAGRAFTVTGVVVDWKGSLVTDAAAVKPLEVEYLRLEEEYGWYYDEGEGQEHHQRFLRPVREGRAQVRPEGGRFQLEVTPGQDAAGYLVRVRSGAAQTDLQLEGSGRFYGWREGGEERVDATPRPLRPTSLALQVPRSARVGEALGVKLRVPYRGRILFTAETDRVLASEWRAVEPGEVAWSFTPRAHAPNVYVSAFLVKDPHLESAQAFLPDRAFGVASVRLEPSEYTRQVTLGVPAEVRSGAALDVDLDLGALEGPTWATVAVVDEGILQLTRFASPDPLQQLFARRALGVETFETLGWTLLVPPAGASRSTGGDADGAGAAGRVQPVKPVALWSGLVRVPDSGKARVRFELPQYRGQLRVMAVTVGPQRVGSASAQVRVRDPLVLQATLPRFLTQGDSLQVPVFVTNVSGAAQDVRVSLSAESLPVPGLEAAPGSPSPLQLLGKREGRVRLEDGQAATLVFQAKAVQAVGAARLRVTAEGGGHVSKEEVDVPFLPAGPRERRVQRIELTAGTTDLAPYLQGWVPTSERSTLWVTANPYADSFDHLKYLLHYPHGCIEQTTSSTRPLLVAGELVESVDPTLVAGGKLDDMVMHGVNRVLSMQTPSGGFAYWPGSTEPSGWGSVYALHMLLDAQRMGYPVPKERVDAALAWMEAELTRKEGGFGRDFRHGDAFRDEEAYMHYVLALSGRPRKARAQKLLEALPARPEGEQYEYAYMLRAALYLAGDRRHEAELKRPDLSAVTEERKNSWSFYSDRRRRGFVLSTFQDLFGSDPAGEPLANLVAEALKRPSHHYTTQELVWGVTGLGKRVKGAAARFTPPTLSADGRPVAAHEGKKGRESERTWALARASERKALTLTLKDKGAGALYLVLASEGVRTDAQPRQGGEGLEVKRTYRTLQGDVLDVKQRPVGLAELVYVELSLRNTSGERIQNIALVDRLPAGWEMENARLGRGGSVDWVERDALWSPDYVNIRDDRLEVFGALERGETRKVVYAVRAVTAGTFVLPPVEAEAMYDPRLWAREGGGTVEVSGPWKDLLL